MRRLCSRVERKDDLEHLLKRTSAELMWKWNFRHNNRRRVLKLKTARNRPQLPITRHYAGVYIHTYIFVYVILTYVERLSELLKFHVAPTVMRKKTQRKRIKAGMGLKCRQTALLTERRGAARVNIETWYVSSSKTSGTVKLFTFHCFGIRAFAKKYFWIQ